MPTAGEPIENFYVSRISWLVGQGREDLIDAVADEFERPCRRVEGLEVSERPAQPWPDRLAG